MKLRLLITLWFITGNTFLAGAAYVFDYNEQCRAAYREFLSLHPEQGNALIRKELSIHPNNLIATYIADYEDGLLLMFNGDKKDYQQREDNMERRLDLMELGDKKSPWYRFCKSGIYLRWSLVYGRFGENFRAASAFRKAYLLAKENEALHPGFAHNKILVGMVQAIAGTIPDDYKWVASIFGIKGNVRRGIGQIVGYINDPQNHSFFKEEAVIYYCYLKFYLLSQQEDIWNFMNSSQFVTRDNLLNTFVKANLAVNFRKADAAKQILAAVEHTDDYKKFPILDYEKGSALMMELDTKGVAYLNRFIQRYNGRMFVKDAWQQLAYAYYIQGNMAQARHCRNQILSQGSRETDADKQAYLFGKNTSWPALPVLKARLLLDGGYYPQAMAQLRSTDVNTLPTVTDKLEYYFRLARVYDVTGDPDKGIGLYHTTIAMGRHRQEHFAARAALQMALLYEKSGRIKEAIASFKDCLSMKNHDFQANIDQQAKAGLNRLTHR